MISWTRMTDLGLNEAERLRNAGELLMATRMAEDRRYLLVFTDRQLVPFDGEERMQLARRYQADRYGEALQRHVGVYTGRKGKGYKGGEP